MTDPRRQFLAAVSVIALQRGGMAVAAVPLRHLANALEAMGALRADDPLFPLQAPARALVEARLASDECLFSQAAWDMGVALCAFWGARLGEEVGQ